MEAIEKDELFDDELRRIVKFTDETVTAPQPVEEGKNSHQKKPIEKKKMVQNPTGKPMDAKYEPVKTWYDEKTANMVKWVVVFVALEYLFFYWQQTGQMQSTAAMPSMIACALLVGISVGKNWKWRQ